MSKLQLKIMGALTVLVVVVVGASGFLAERGLRETTTNNIRVNLEREARLIEQLVAGIPFDASNAQRLQSLVLRAASSTGSRITLIDADGRVIADSDVPEEEIGTLSNHADRPEIIQAAEVGDGYGIRRSETLKHALLYVALRTDADAGSNNRGFVRLAIYLDEVDAAAANLRRELIAAGLMGLLVALAVSYGLSLLSLRPVRELR
jgi:two-component system phosphate regulon sensor histidine kinase PhoR